jgi:hypothetical protein
MHPSLPMENTNKHLILKCNIILDGYDRKRRKENMEEITFLFSSENC